MELRYTTGLDDHMAFYDYAVEGMPVQKRNARFTRLLLSVNVAVLGFVIGLVMMWAFLGQGLNTSLHRFGFEAVITIWMSDLLFPGLMGVFSGVGLYMQWPKANRKQYREQAARIYTDDDDTVRDKNGWLQITPERLNISDRVGYWAQVRSYSSIRLSW